MKTILKNLAFLIFVLPLTLILDLMLFGLVKACPSCGNFWQFVQTEGSLSFPIVTSMISWFDQYFIRPVKKN